MLDEILKKPESYRKKIAYISTFVVSIMVFSVWMIIAEYNMRQSVKIDPNEKAKYAKDFRKSLPSLKQKDAVVTELAKRKTLGKANEIVINLVLESED